MACFAGFFEVKKFEGGDDKAGAQFEVLCENRMDKNEIVRMYLPPYLRRTQCDIDVGSIIYGLFDNITGRGVALFGLSECDYGYFFDADMEIRKSLSVTKDITSMQGDIKSSTGDVVATTISLSTHTHQIFTMTPQDAALVVGSASSGIPAEFTSFFTYKPVP